MNLYYEQLNYHNSPFQWVYRNRTTEPFQGYYHLHQGYELLVIHQGRGNVVVNQQTYPISGGKVFFFKPLQLHRVHVDIDDDHPYERSVFHFNAVHMESYLAVFPSVRDFFMRLSKGLVKEQTFDMSDRIVALEQACQEFSAQIAGASAVAKGDQSAIYLLRLLSLIQGKIGPKVDDEERGGEKLRYSERVMEWLEENYSTAFKLEVLADELHMSKSYLSRMFRKETGSSMTEYLSARRIQEACSLLQSSDYSIERIGEMVGLSNASYFIQLFKKMMGISPHQYRLKL
ncbi:AraC family transcriptional regulator [Paenibacillus chungangensis]|uniref:AraC family transcriptional regulator n=1 Tax=Paenibacillus chungangensis TaxID=696535 RepID=A0ABW3HXA2_9BACL